MKLLPSLAFLATLLTTTVALPMQDAEERDAGPNNFPIPTPTITIPPFPLPTGFPGTGIYTVPPITIPTSFSFPIPTFSPPPIPTITPPSIPSFPWFAAEGAKD